jgi:hypothetical protein
MYHRAPTLEQSTALVEHRKQEEEEPLAGDAAAAVERVRVYEPDL